MKKSIENLMLFSWVTAFIATLGSLYFSEIQRFEPCNLCWYQRILMYPLVIILLIGIIRKEASASIYAAALSGIGLCISIYHYSIQKLPGIEGTGPGCGRVPCTGDYINWFGFITIPFLAGTAFLMIFITSLLIIKRNRG
ncbi:disulfide oxidoreductase [Alkalicoccobacillus porphyridii]|uniref:Probable disulfide formation protein n=1 Tax=Alkalicoccobacillus porphyridii TaxID=2597270 RepID=A0A553ZU44_9BACI|nr:disulfide oxidoreductase [Alkalicoccobacillus porphyridii]TSB45009.1 disulfide bond formation protein B [Alkalicoccobacillus porphyridii]